MTITRTYDTATSSVVDEIKRHHSRVFRRAYIRRRIPATQFIEWDSEWIEITGDVKSWGSVGSNVDYERYGVTAFHGTNLVMDNESGRYNRYTNSDSLWAGFGDYETTLVKIECGYIHQYLGTDGIWRNTEYPTNPTVFIGIISGDINLSDKSEVTLPVTTSFDFVAKLPVAIGYGAWYDAEDFFTYLRDLPGGYALPLFGDSTGGITIDTVTPADWYTYIPPMDQGFTVLQWLEVCFRNFNCFLQVKADGSWRLRNKDVTATASFEFFGRSRGAVPDGTYGHTIKEVKFYGPKVTGYHSPVVLNFGHDSGFGGPLADYSVSRDATTTVTNLYGTRPLRLENDHTGWSASGSKEMFSYFAEIGVSDPTAAGYAVADNILETVGRVDEQIEFTTSLITHLNLLDRVEITFDSSGIEAESGLWDLNKWDTELVWDAGASGSISLTSEPFKIISVKINLDNLETTFIARQIN